MNNKLKKIFGNKYAIIVISAVASSGVTLAASNYIFNKKIKIIEEDYEKRMDILATTSYRRGVIVGSKSSISMNNKLKDIIPEESNEIQSNTDIDIKTKKELHNDFDDTKDILKEDIDEKVVDDFLEDDEESSNAYNKALNMAQEVHDEPVYEINPEEFGEIDDIYDKISVTYYRGDDVLSDDEYNEILDTETTITFKIIDDFISCNKEVGYVRNEKLKIDYEVVIDEDSYSHVVLGEEYTNKFDKDIDSENKKNLKQTEKDIYD